jgi:hypothetical protein
VLVTLAAEIAGDSTTGVSGILRRVGDVLVDGVSRRCLHVRHITDLVAVLVLVTQWCRAPVDALAVLKNKMQIFN